MLLNVKLAFPLYAMLKIRDESIIIVFIAQYNGIEPIMRQKLNVRSGFKLNQNFDFPKSRGMWSHVVFSYSNLIYVIAFEY